MGAFFQGEGTSTLCPNVKGQGSGGGGRSVSSATDVLTALASSYAHGTVQATTSTIIATKSISDATSSTAGAASTTTSQVILTAAVTPNSPSSLRPTITAQSKFSTSRSSSSTSTSSSSGGGGNGGGTILDVGSSSASHNAKIESWVLFLLAGSAGLVWLL